MTRLKNGKADTLSGITAKENKQQNEETILPKTCWLNTIEWEFNKEIENSLPYKVPADSPSSVLYLPDYRIR